MDSVLISEFKAKCIQLLERVNATGRPLSVTLRGQPLARVELARPASPQKVGLGEMSGSVEIKSGIVHFDASAEWETEK